jgi:hypothetical protein
MMNARPPANPRRHASVTRWVSLTLGAIILAVVVYRGVRGLWLDPLALYLWFGVALAAIGVIWPVRTEQIIRRIGDWAGTSP